MTRPNAIRRVALTHGADVEGFRRAVRLLVANQVPPQDVVWTQDDTPSLLGEPLRGDTPSIALPRALAELIPLVVCHRDPQRYGLLYSLVWRVLHGEPALLSVHSDRLMHRIDMLGRAIRRDLHKMHAFLRFRQVDAEAERFVAWFEPQHFIVEATAQFFVDRFRGFAWSILTPVGSLHWDRASLVVGPPAQRADAPAADGFEAGWCGYYESIFNPARVNPTAMRTEMAKKYWHNMPEAAAIPALIRSAQARTQAMIEKEAAMPIKRNPDKALAAMWEREPKSLEELNRIIASSQPLVPGATQAVLGEGPVGADVAFVGEQPGDQEDVQGKPFVGPAGLLLSRAMDDAGIERRSVYVTNAVKHFKFEQRGKRRIHQTPTAGEVKHYRWWLQQELGFVRPKVVVALGAIAVLALAGKPLPIIRNRGPATFDGPQFDGMAGFITVHPSYLIRLPDEFEKQRAYGEFVADLRRVHTMIEQEKEHGADRQAG